MNLPAADYDVATDATPEQVQSIFGRNKSIMVGAAFGVVCVNEKIDRVQYNVEVATFRSDGVYSDGRRPESVQYTTPEQDAQRRDFTINGLFFDPIQNEVIDFVGGREDIEKRIIRAIGNPKDRFTEDKLRLIRAVRFAARFGFEIESTTKAAIFELADTIMVVSAERIAAELRKIFVLPNCAAGIELLNEVGLLAIIFPELSTQMQDPKRQSIVLDRVSNVEIKSFESILAILCWSILSESDAGSKPLVEALGSRWRLSNQEAASVKYIISALPVLLDADQVKWSSLQPILLSPDIRMAINVAKVLLLDRDGHAHLINRCEEALKLERSVLDPIPLIDGRVLMEIGIPVGPNYARLIKAARVAQLDGVISTEADAKEWIRANC